MKEVIAQSVTVGMWLENIGFIDRVELFPTANLVCLSSHGGIVKSAAFFWYAANTPLKVRIPTL